jgi:hypothetical protein
MIITTVAAVIGVLTMFTAMLQGISFHFRYGAIVVMIVSAVVFAWSFLSLGTQG